MSIRWTRIRTLPPPYWTGEGNRIHDALGSGLALVTDVMDPF